MTSLIYFSLCTLHMQGVRFLGHVILLAIFLGWLPVQWLLYACAGGLPGYPRNDQAIQPGNCLKYQARQTDHFPMFSELQNTFFLRHVSCYHDLVDIIKCPEMSQDISLRSGDAFSKKCYWLKLFTRFIIHYPFCSFLLYHGRKKKVMDNFFFLQRQKKSSLQAYRLQQSKETNILFFFPFCLTNNH